MKRRALLSGLFALGATVAFSDPAQARRRRRGGRIRRARTRYQNVSYSGSTPRRTVHSQAMGDLPASQVGQSSQRQLRASSNPYAETRSDNGTLEEKQVYRFRELYSTDQSRQAMRSALGEPAEHHWDRDVWKIRRIGIDGKPNGQYGRFVARYKWGRGGWDGKTAEPPLANW